MKSNSRAVYTAVIGGYESLTEQPDAAGKGIPLICFTDDASLTSDTWEIRVVERAFERDITRSARVLKVRGHESLREFDETLWVDNAVRLKGDPVNIFEEWLVAADLALPRHSYRAELVAEFDVVAETGFDDPNRIYEQLNHYWETSPDLLAQRPYWTAILARRRTEEVDRTMTYWLDHILRYSRRDQLSINYAISRSGIAVNAIDIENFESPIHVWPVAERNRGLKENRFQEAMRPQVADTGRLMNDIGELSRSMDNAIKERESIIAAQHSAIEGLHGEIESLRRRVDDEANEVAALRSSTSWRITGGLRRVSSVLRKKR